LKGEQKVFFYFTTYIIPLTEMTQYYCTAGAVL